MLSTSFLVREIVASRGTLSGQEPSLLGIEGQLQM